MTRRVRFATVVIAGMGACSWAAAAGGTAIVKAVVEPYRGAEAARPALEPARVNTFTVDRRPPRVAAVDVFWRAPAGGLPGDVQVVLDLLVGERREPWRLWRSCGKGLRGPQRTRFELREPAFPVVSGVASVVMRGAILARAPLDGNRE